jgi:two-component system, cell cycle response regulator CpdR
MGAAYRAIALVVEDDEILRSMAAMLLEETDIRVIQCESAEAAELVRKLADVCA